ncbi:Uncharacterised protein [Mycobacteroides abscessus subsp. abscessus]|nr:Uncharacterised protein [Mycobacteroides abscessus subsp. abscessus]
MGVPVAAEPPNHVFQMFLNPSVTVLVTVLAAVCALLALVFAVLAVFFTPNNPLTKSATRLFVPPKNPSMSC